jgi:soluble lytic murein transglycosylase-like protein
VTTGVLATFPLAIGHELHFELGRMRALFVALLATACVALAFTSILRVDRLVASSALTPAAPADAGRADAPPAAPAARPGTPALSREIRPEIDALATLVAKRYRISPKATRGLVATAYREGRRIGLDPLLIIAVIAVESRFNPIAQSDVGAQGLMQVIPGYHKDRLEAAGVDSVLDPHANIRLGAQILKDYIRKGGTEVAGLQLYNGSADDATNTYASKVLTEKQRFEQVVERVRLRRHA